MNLKCVVIDDEQHAIEVLTDHIAEMPGLTVFKTFTSPVQALTEISVGDEIDLFGFHGSSPCHVRSNARL